jgi:hypothetical protein
MHVTSSLRYRVFIFAAEKDSAQINIDEQLRPRYIQTRVYGWLK